MRDSAMKDKRDAVGLEAERTRLLEAERAARAEAEQARREAEAASDAKSQFLAAMSHEIRTPINAIIGYTQLLSLGIDGPVTPAQQERLDRMRWSGQHLLGLVNDVLDLAKSESGQMTVATEVGVTGDAVSSSIALTMPQAAARRVYLLDCTDGERGAEYLGDHQRVRQIVVNLLDNAIKFTAEGGRVEVYCGETGERPAGAILPGHGPWAYIRVEDTGIGIEPDRQALVFEPFVQAESGLTRSRGGTGLGLTISRRLARLMRGDLTMRSEPGKGSIFTLWLPNSRETKAAQQGAMTGDASDTASPGRLTGLGRVGLLLRESIEEIIAEHVARIQGDVAFPRRGLQRTDVEDHIATLIVNVAQSLRIIEESGGPDAGIFKDGGEIQRVIARMHGRQRRRLGWTVSHVEREYAALFDGIREFLGAKGTTPPEELAEALEVIRQLLDRARDTSVLALRGE